MKSLFLFLILFYIYGVLCNINISYIAANSSTVSPSLISNQTSSISISQNSSFSSFISPKISGSKESSNTNITTPNPTPSITPSEMITRSRNFSNILLSFSNTPTVSMETSQSINHTISNSTSVIPSVSISNSISSTTENFTISVSPSNSSTLLISPSNILSNSSTLSVSITSASRSPIVSNSSSPIPVVSVSNTTSVTILPTVSNLNITHSRTLSATPSMILSNSSTISISISNSTKSPTPTLSNYSTPTATVSSSNSSTSSITPSPTGSNSSTLSQSISASSSFSRTPTSSNSSSATVSTSTTSTATSTATPSSTPSPTLSNSDTPSITTSPTISNSSTSSVSPTPTVSNSSTSSPSYTSTVSLSPSPTLSNSSTSSISISNTPTPTVSMTSTISISATSSRTSSKSFSNTPTITVSPTVSNSNTASTSFSSSRTPTSSISTTPSPSLTATPISTISQLWVSPESSPGCLPPCGYSADCPCNSIQSALNDIDIRSTKTITIYLFPGTYSGNGNTNLIFPTDTQANIIISPVVSNNSSFQVENHITISCNSDFDSGFIIPDNPKGTFEFNSISFLHCGTSLGGVSKALRIGKNSTVTGNNLEFSGQIYIDLNAYFNCSFCTFDPTIEARDTNPILFDRSFIITKDNSDVYFQFSTFSNIHTRSVVQDYAISSLEIYNSNVAINNCIFSDNSNLDGYNDYTSSCIYSSGNSTNNTIIINNTNFTNNAGDTIVIDDITLYVDSVYFDTNTQGSLLITYGSTADFTNSYFLRNTDLFFASIALLPSRNIPNQFPYVTFENCEFNENINLVGNGGAVYIETGTLYISNSNFNSNRARKGGAIFGGPQIVNGNGNEIDLTNEKTLFINSCSFDNNIGSTSGGAIEFEGKMKEFTIQYSNFTNNLSPNGEGAALKLYFTNETTAIISDSNFTNNQADIGVGGAIHVGGNVNFLDNTFLNNIAKSAGALFIDVGKISIKGNEFISNSAEIGGAVLVTGNVIGSSVGNSYYSNSATFSGGGIYISGYSNITFVNEYFSDNSADSVGGAIAMNDFTSSTMMLSIIENTVTTGSGAISCMRNSTPIFYDTIIRGNAASQEGAGIYIQDHSSPIFFLCSIINNNCTTAAGGIVASENAAGKFENCSISNNFAGNNAGGIKVNGNSSTQFINCSITYNFASGDGGGISIEDQSTALFDGGIISNNTATSSGGGIAIHGESEAIIRNLNIKDNFALSHGGGIALQDRSNSLISYCTITNNTSPVNGGGIVAMDLTTSTISNCKITYNYAESDGGGIQIITFAEPKIDTCYVTNNFASSKGGGIHLANFCKPKITNTFIQYNNGTNGAGCTISNDAEPTIKNCSITNNFANSQGGGLLLEDYAIGNFTDCYIDLNIANTGSGGGILALDYSSTFFYSCSILSNKATTSGAGIQTSSNSHPYFESCTINSNIITLSDGGALMTIGNSYPYFKNCEIRYNQADSGAAFWIGKDSYPIIINSDISFNNANRRGGGIYIQTGGNSIVNDTTISNNTALQGGGLYCELHALGLFTDVIWSKNEAISDGGGAFLSCGHTIFEKPHFSQNTAQNGGGIAIETCILTAAETHFNMAEFSGNSAELGGGLYIISDSTELKLQNENTKSINSAMSYYYAEDYTCNNCTFSSNIAEYGGAIYHGSSYFTITLGDSILFNDNAASKIGGAIFMMEPDIKPDNAWVYGAAFKENNAGWAASTVGFSSIPVNASSSDITLFCENCNFIGDNTVGSVTNIGYQTTNGFATPPVSTAIQEQLPCPNSALLVSDPFSVGIILKDQFNTVVQGLIFESITYRFNVSIIFDENTPCNLISQNYTEGMNTNGNAIFPDLLLQGTESNNCVLQFYPISFPNNEPLTPTTCQVELTGCPKNEHQDQLNNGPYDTCVDNTGISLASTITLTTILLLILILLIIVFCYCLFAMHRRQKPKSDRFVGSLPDFDRSKPVTIYEILNDPQIPVIPWADIMKFERIGIGGSGMVWRGELISKSESRPVALKQLLFGIDNITEELVSAFLREIKLMSVLRHENVVEFIGVSISDSEGEESELYLVTELMQNGSLSDLFLKKKFNMPWALRLRLIQDAACGMAYFHSRNLIHRDLKSQNLLVNDKWICKIADFGISTIKPAAEKTMTCIGTPVYMAPEVIGSNKYSEKADIFSFGVLLVETYSLKPPYSEPKFQSVTQAQLMYQICHQGLRPPTDDFPLPLVQLVNDCWNETPEMRPSFPEIIIRLHRLESLSLGEDINFPIGEDVPLRKTHTYTTFHEMISPDGEDNEDNEIIISPKRLSINIDNEQSDNSTLSD